MARNVNVFLTNWHWTGQSVLTPQATVDLEIQWVDEEGSDQQWSGTATFPNDLRLVPVAWLKEKLEELLLEAARKRLGVD